LSIADQQETGGRVVVILPKKHSVGGESGESRCNQSKGCGL